MMKKLVRKMMAVTLAVIIAGGNAIDTYAFSVSDAAETMAVLGPEAKALAEDAYVMAITVGRSGAATVTGAKGIAFEAKYLIKQNIANLLKGTGEQIFFTANSQAQQVDLIGKSAGKVTQRIQCKTATSKTGIRQIINAVKDGKYQQAKLVGTTECAQEFNTAAAKAGISKRMIDSGIKEADLAGIVDKMLGNAPSVSEVTENLAKKASLAAVINGGFALVDSIRSGDDEYETTANVLTETAEGMIVGSAMTASTDLTACGLGVAGFSGASTVLVPIVVGGIVCYLAVKVSDSLEESTCAKAKLACTFKEATDIVKDFTVDTVDVVGASCTTVYDKMGKYWSKIFEKVKFGKQNIV